MVKTVLKSLFDWDIYILLNCNLYMPIKLLDEENIVKKIVSSIYIADLFIFPFILIIFGQLRPVWRIY